MDEWVGATEETVRYEWGKPDLIDNVGKATVYYYEGDYKAKMGNLTKCTVRFYLINGIVSDYRWDGANCRMHRRPKNN